VNNKPKQSMLLPHSPICIGLECLGLIHDHPLFRDSLGEVADGGCRLRASPELTRTYPFFDQQAHAVAFDLVKRVAILNSEGRNR
jgi:hypothetical protein